MDSYTNILEMYDKLMSLIEKDNYYFCIKNSSTKYDNLSYDEFISIIPNIYYIDNSDQNYSRIYLNPSSRMLLLFCARKLYDGKLALIRIPISLINTVYSLIENCITKEYHDTLDLIRKNIYDLEKIEVGSEIQFIDLDDKDGDS